MTRREILLAAFATLAVVGCTPQFAATSRLNSFSVTKGPGDDKTNCTRMSQEYQRIALEQKAVGRQVGARVFCTVVDPEQHEQRRYEFRPTFNDFGMPESGEFGDKVEISPIPRDPRQFVPFTRDVPAAVPPPAPLLQAPPPQALPPAPKVEPQGPGITWVSAFLARLQMG